ncbi:MAG: response regulator [Chloroflexota bacterium]
MIKVHSGSPVPRIQVFVLGSGDYAVQWTDTSVQDLLTGAYRDYQLRDFGHRVTDLELEQLKTSGVVEGYDQTYVWVYALPEDHNFGALRTLTESSNKTRCYYINTTLPADRLTDLQAKIDTLDFAGSVCAREHEGLVALLGRDTMPFSNLKDAENIQRKLQAQLPGLLENAAVAFTELGSDFAPVKSDQEAYIDLDLLIASQTDTKVTQGKLAVIACRDDRQRRSIMNLLSTMEMAVSSVKTAQETLNLLEEEPIDVLIMDERLDDMHGWAMIGKLREIAHAAKTRVVVLAEQGTDEQVFALTVAKVDIYMHKPLSLPLLRQNIWMMLRETDGNQ